MMHKIISQKNPCVGIYIHIPFCIQICPYCDFVKFRRNQFTQSQITEYQQALEKEIRLFFEHYPDTRVKTIYFGGGTPSLYPLKYMESLLHMLNEKKFSPQNEALEITIEVDPKTIALKKLQTLKNLGFNRLSIGAQSFIDSHLKNLGRYHREKDILKLVEGARLADFTNISIDLMFGTPHQTRPDFENNLRRAVSLSPSHISLYALSLHRGTPFFRQRTKLVLPSDANTALFYNDACKFLKDHGIFNYEISNFAKKGCESRHNTDCWNLVPYLGFGVGACSFFDQKRWKNRSTFDAYLQHMQHHHHARTQMEVISTKESMLEYAILALRQSQGLRFNDFSLKFGKSLHTVFPFLNALPLEYSSLLIQKKHSIKLSQKGKMLSNEVFQLFFN